GSADSIHDCRDVLDDRVLHRTIRMSEARPRPPHGSRPCAAVDHAASRLACARGLRSAHALSRGSLGIITGLIRLAAAVGRAWLRYQRAWSHRLPMLLEWQGDFLSESPPVPDGRLRRARVRGPFDPRV